MEWQHLTFASAGSCLCSACQSLRPRPRPDRRCHRSDRSGCRSPDSNPRPSSSTGTDCPAFRPDFGPTGG
uniref:Putative secreted peptide n=1 Tax=Anopheles braziliensis TaxID=58242 RepID=A0A2M3ZV12_9DIPT